MNEWLKTKEQNLADKHCEITSLIPELQTFMWSIIHWKNGGIRGTDSVFSPQILSTEWCPFGWGWGVESSGQDTLAHVALQLSWKSSAAVLGPRGTTAAVFCYNLAEFLDFKDRTSEKYLEIQMMKDSENSNGSSLPGGPLLRQLAGLHPQLVCAFSAHHGYCKTLIR